MLVGVHDCDTRLDSMRSFLLQFLQLWVDLDAVFRSVPGLIWPYLIAMPVSYFFLNRSPYVSRFSKLRFLAQPCFYKYLEISQRDPGFLVQFDVLAILPNDLMVILKP